MDNSNSKITIPNPFAPTNEKNKKKFGTSVCRYILNSTKEYIKLRNAEFWKNRQYASGKQSLQPLLDLMEVDGKNTYANIRWKPNPIAKKFERVFSSTYMLEQHEHVKVTSLTKHIRDRKTNKKNEARFRMDNRELIAMLSEEAGMPIEDPNAFIPESEEELNIYFDLNDKEKEEVLMQDTLSFLINDIDFERLKMRHLQESFRVNLSGYYISNNPNTGRVDVEIIKGENCIYSPSERDDFGDITYAGRYVNMSVSAIRNRFEITDEKEFYEAIRKELGGKGMGNIRWEETYRGRAVRPYDSLVVPVTHVWWLTSKVKSYVSGKDNYGRTIFDVTDAVEDFNTYAKSGGRKIKSTLYPETAYEGFFLGDGQFCLEWGEQKNKFIYKGKILCPFVFHMAENEGSMLEPSPLNNILDEIEEMDLATLKIKQLIAKSAPEGYAIDVSSLEKLDIGTGGELTPLDVMQIYRQTGDIYYSSESEDGVRNYQAPVQPTQSYIVQKMEAYVLSYNRALENIRDKLGINEFRDGSASNARTGYRFAQTQLQASNTATYVFYRGWLKTAEELVKRIGLITWNNAKYGTADNRFLNFIGKENVEFIKNIKDIVKAEYSFKYELTMTATEKQNLDDNIATALSAGLIEMSDAIMIKRVADLSVAERTLAYISEKRREQRIKEAQDNSQIQAEASAQAGVAVEQEKAKTEEFKAQLEMAKEKVRQDGEQQTVLLKGVLEMVNNYSKNDKEIPSQWEEFINQGISSALLKTNKSAMDTQKEIEAEQMQDMQEEEVLGEIENLVSSGQISEEEAMEMLGGEGY